MSDASTLSRRGLAALLAGAALLASAPAFAQSTLDRAKEAGFIRVGFANEAPFAYATPDGRLTGEAPEIAKAVLALMGIPEVDGVLTEFGSLIPGLQAGRFDIIAAGMFVTPARCQQIAFSEPSYGIGQALMVRDGNPKGLHNYDDIREHADATLGVMAGAVERQYARDSEIPDARVQVFPDGPSGLAAVRAGRVDAFALTSLSIRNLVETAGAGSGVEMSEPFSEVAGEVVVGHGAFGFRQQDSDLLEAFNQHLVAFLGTDAHIDLVTPFGFGKGFLPVQSTEELCAG
jgi:polar amino acid transport system substrate-binding protein